MWMYMGLWGDLVFNPVKEMKKIMCKIEWNHIVIPILPEII